MALMGLTETSPTAPKPTGTASMVPTGPQAATDGDLSSNTKCAMPGTVGGGAGANTYRWIGPNVNNGTTTDQGEPNTTTVTGFGWVACVSQTGVLMPFSSIAAGTWTYRITTSQGLWTGTVSIGVRFWQISNDRSTKTMITMPGADANGWVFSAVAGSGLKTITIAGVSAVTFATATPYLYVEAICKIGTVGATTGTLAFSTGDNLTIPAASYGRTTSDTATASESVSRSVQNGRAASDTASITGDSGSRSISLNRSGSDTAVASDAATRQFVGSRSASDSVPLSGDAATRRFVGSRAGSDTAPFTSDAASRVSAVNRSASDSAPASDSASRVSSVARFASDTASVSSDAVTRRVVISRASSDNAPFSSDSASRIQNLRRSATDYLAGTPDFPVTFATKSISGVVYDHETGSPLTSSAATVKLIRDVDDFVCQSTTQSLTDGSFSFPRDRFDPYTYHYTAEFTSGGVQYHGISDRGMTPT